MERLLSTQDRNALGVLRSEMGGQCASDAGEQGGNGKEMRSERKLRLNHMAF